ncbi:MAG: hypothetical protein KME49_19580 [Brasilonema octagenarum HA4186-MV1]|uniref:hypothetical protein n=1 Tax=Brasilonema sennae TaxID=1397703 RepID=UPI001C12ED6E|nr:hypothetical protein [Brasilonema sennae]MBW4627641.1 hypothetical protein [Brasilonema octagenarum HA4186-MV1]
MNCLPETLGERQITMPHDWVNPVLHECFLTVPVSAKRTAAALGNGAAVPMAQDIGVP